MKMKKIKTMVMSKQEEDEDIKADIQINDETLEQVSTFKCPDQKDVSRWSK